MRIGLDARYLYDHFPGIGRITIGLVRALAALDHGHTLVVLSNSRLPNTRHDLSALGAAPAVELVDLPLRPFSLAEQVRMPLIARRLRLDIYHAPYYVRPYLGLPCPAIVSIHDLIGHHFPQMLARRGRLLYRIAMSLSVHSARMIITSSQHARAELARTYRFARAPIAVVPHGIEVAFRPLSPAALAAVRVRYGLPDSYTLYLGSNKPHKNLVRLVQAWEQLATSTSPPVRTQLIIAGHEDPAYPEARQFVEARNLSEWVRFLPGVAERDLPAIYGAATVFVFPSCYEGFGLPPLEAMACGTPVLCANTTSLPEVVGDAALTIDPYSTAALAAGMRRLLDDAALRQELSARGLRRAAQFNWTNSARALVRLYEQVR